MDTATLLAGVEWLGHASVRIRDALTVYIDPWELKGDQPRADVVLITHGHYDHLSPSDVRKVAGPDTVVVAPADCGEKLREGMPDLKFVAAAAGKPLEARGLPILPVAAYNIGKRFHPREAGGLGYRVQFPGRSIYHAGDTDDTPELRGVRTDLLLIPVGGTYTLTASEAAAVARAIGPRLAVPLHWGKIVGSVEDARLFRTQAGVPVEILEPVR